ncbi:unnamed protein product [Polarella glacialis]|uniref:Tryptophan-rich sensory protein n=1 Tax=Polarella glacialis TaxID=89957 RepID=A0A813H103_POLGL|nr:unnamed protein product [Polarella glacialis]
MERRLSQKNRHPGTHFQHRPVALASMAAAAARKRSHANLRPKGLKRLIAAFVVMAVTNGLAGTGGYGFPKNNAELSDLNPTYLTPDGLTFAVWGIIYLLQLLALLEAVANKAGFYVPRREQVLSYLTLAFLLNSAWLVVFAHELYGLSLLVMVGYLLALLGAYTDLDPCDTDLFLPAAVSVNLAWVCVATCLNGLITAARFGLGGAPLRPAGEALAAVAGTQNLACAAAGGLTLLALHVLRGERRDWPFAATLAWALWGISRGQAARSEFLARAAVVCAGLCALAAGWVLAQRLCGRRTVQVRSSAD